MDTDEDFATIRVFSNRTARAKWLQLPKIFGYDFFISFKLGASPAGAQSYASDLARCLRELDYTVFYSEEEAAPGAELDSTLIKALRRSRILIVLATPGALKSHWVRKEVEEFRARRPSRPVIIINVDRAIETEDKTTQVVNWLGYEGRIWLDETAVAIQDGIVNKVIVDRIRLAPQFLRANILLRSSVAIVVLALAMLTSFAWYKHNESHDRLVAYNLSQGRASLTSGRALQAAPSLMRAFQDGAQSSDVRFMLAQAFASVDRLLAKIDSTALTFSSDGKLMAIARKNGSIEIRDSHDLSTKTILKWKKDTFFSALMFSPDGEKLIAEVAIVGNVNSDLQHSECMGGRRGNAYVTLWDVNTGTLLKTIAVDHLLDCQHTFFQGQGQLITTASWTTERLDLKWSASTFDQAANPIGSTKMADDRECHLSRAPLSPQQDDTACPGQIIGFASGGLLLATAPWDLRQRSVDIWSLSSGRKQTLLLGRDANLRSVAFSPNGESVAMTLVDGVEIWRLDKPARISYLNIETTDVPVSFSPDNTRVVVISGGRDAKILDANNLRSLAVLTGHATQVRVAVFSSDGTRVLTAGDDGIGMLWDGWTGRLLATLEGHKGPVVNARFSPDDHLIFTQDASGFAYLWDNRSLTIPRTLRSEQHEDPSWSAQKLEMVEHSSDGGQIGLSHVNSGSVQTFWDTTHGLILKQWRDPESLGSVSSERRVAPIVRLPCAEDFLGRETQRPLASDAFGTVVVVDSQSDGQSLVVRSGRKPCSLVRLEGHRAKVTAAAIQSSKDRVVTADERGEIRIWNLKNGLQISQLQAESPVVTLAFLTTDRVVAIDDRNTAVVYDLPLEERSTAELKRKLYCTDLFTSEELLDLAPGDANCESAVPSRNEWASAAANALSVGAWGSRHQNNTASILLVAANLYGQAGDIFGVIQVTIALRVLALDSGDIGRAKDFDLRARSLISELAKDKTQQFRLLRLGEIAFNEFNDIELAKLCWTSLLTELPNEYAAHLALQQISIFEGHNQRMITTDHKTMRTAVLRWINAEVVNEDIDDYAHELWHLYAGTMIDLPYESLDFRGLLRQLKSSSISEPTKKKISDVLYELRFPDDRSNELKRLLGIPEDEQPAGP